MSSFFKNILPPIIYSKLSKNKLLKKLNHKYKRYNSYEEAKIYCTENAYENDELLDNIYKKTLQFKDKLECEPIPFWDTSAYSLLSLINPIIENNCNSINVIDFGGAMGAHYYQLRKLIDKKINLKWYVIETKSMVKHAQSLENFELKFFDNFSDAIKKIERIDLLHTSGTIQFVESPELILKDILHCNAKWILFNRLGLNRKNTDFITIHSSKLSWNGIGNFSGGSKDKWIKYPCIYMSESKFLNYIQEQYKIIAKFNDQSGIFEVEGQEIVGYGLLCKSDT